MTTVLAHAAVGWSIARLLTPHASPWLRRRVPDAALLLAMLPDADVVGFRFGVRYEDLLGHRGISHSLAFAVVFGALVGFGLSRLTGDRRGIGMAVLALVLATLSHPLLDMLTDGGLGCALWAPFSHERLFFPWTPIPVSPIGIGPGLASVLLFEVKIFAPVAALAWILSRVLQSRVVAP